MVASFCFDGADVVVVEFCVVGADVDVDVDAVVGGVIVVVCSCSSSGFALALHSDIDALCCWYVCPGSSCGANRCIVVMDVVLHIARCFSFGPTCQ